MAQKKSQYMFWREEFSVTYYNILYDRGIKLSYEKDVNS